MNGALEEQYGGVELSLATPRFNNSRRKFTYTNACMLVYVRESEKDKIICNVDEKDIAENLRIRLKKEHEEEDQKRKYNAEAYLYTSIKVARDRDLYEQIGKHIYFDLVDNEKVCCFRIRKQTPFFLFQKEVAKVLGIPVEHQRFWVWAKRQNHTYRLHRPLAPHETVHFVGRMSETFTRGKDAELKLFLEADIGQDLQTIPLHEKTEDEILIFFKLYDPLEEELRYVGRLFVKNAERPTDIMSKLKDLSGFYQGEEIELYVELEIEPNVICKHIDQKLTFEESQLQDGDIICLQKVVHTKNTETLCYPNVQSFLQYVHDRQDVRFRALEKPMEEGFTLELSKLCNYIDVVERVAHHLNLDDLSKIRLTSHNCYSQKPKPQPIKHWGVERLPEMLAPDNQTSDILYYQVTDISLPEFQGLKTLKVAFHHATKEEVLVLAIRLPKQSTVEDAINELKTKVELSHKDADLRLLEIFGHKIYKTLPLYEKIENINDYFWTLRAEEIPEEEKDLDPLDHIIHVYHIMEERTPDQMVQHFGEPFFLVIREDETLANVKVRIQNKLKVSDEEFTKWKFSFLCLGPSTYLQDSDIVYTHFQRSKVYYNAWEQYLGLEHSPKTLYAAHQTPSDVNTSFSYYPLDHPSLMSDCITDDCLQNKKTKRSFDETISEDIGRKSA